MIDHLGARFSRILRISVMAFSDRRHRHAAITEIQGLDPAIRNRILAESSLTFEDLRDVRAPLFSRDLLSAAMRTLHIGRDSFRAHHGAWYRDMQLTCMRCRFSKRCRRDIANRRFASIYQHYCLNAASLAEILSGRTGEG